MKHFRVKFLLKTGFEREFEINERELEKLSKQQPNEDKWVTLPNKLGGVTMLRDDDITLIEVFEISPDSGER